MTDHDAIVARLTALADDYAALYDCTPAEALELLQHELTDEREPIRVIRER